MSIKHMTDVWENRKHLSGSRLLLMLAIADHANDEGVCWPSIPTLAARIRASERQTMRLIKDLAECGDIEILQRGDGRGHSNVYQIKGDIQGQKGDTGVTVSKKKGDIQGAVKGDIQDQKGDISGIKGDIAMSHQPPIEPPIEPSKRIEPPPSGGGGVKRNRQTDPDYDHICRLVENNLGQTIVPISEKLINEMMDAYPVSHIENAIRVSVQNKKYTLAYVGGVLRRAAEKRNYSDSGKREAKKQYTDPAEYAPRRSRYEVPERYADVVIG